MQDEKYSIGELAKLSGLSTRALRHYDDIGLLAAQRLENDYRIYGSKEVQRLQEILTMRACGITLANIKAILDDTEANTTAKLLKHIQSLKKQSDLIDSALRNTRNALIMIEGMQNMDDKQRFEDLKRHSIEVFEETYGKEARELYGNEAINSANEKFASMTQDEWDAKELLEEGIKVQLRIAMATKDPISEASQELVHMHKRWIKMHWGDGMFNIGAYRGLAQGYLCDPRFITYYDSACGNGATEFLVDAILSNC